MRKVHAILINPRILVSNIVRRCWSIYLSTCMPNLIFRLSIALFMHFDMTDPPKPWLLFRSGQNLIGQALCDQMYCKVSVTLVNIAETLLPSDISLPDSTESSIL